MQAAPPPLPSPALARVLAVARADAWSVVLIGGLSALWLAFSRDFGTAAIAAAVTLAGGAEFRGRRLLLGHDARGRSWLMGAQLGLLVLLCGYAWYRWHHFDADAMWSRFPAFYQRLISARLTAAGLDPELDRDTLLSLTNQLTSLALAFVTLIYQGGLTLYYQRRAVLPPKAGDS